MKLPENIVKLLSSGLDSDIEIGMMLSLKYADNKEDYRMLILRIYFDIEDYNKQSALNMFYEWRGFFRENKGKYEEENSSKITTVK